MKLHALLPSATKRAVWNLKYWLLGYPHWPAPEGTIEYLCRRLCNRSAVLELGCGRGNLLSGMRAAGWKGQYCGVDISGQAIGEAQRMFDQRSSWVVSCIEKFDSSFLWDAIVLIESVYYVNLHELPDVLKRLQKLLYPSGFILVRVHDFNSHREYVDTIRLLFPDVELIDGSLLCFH